jgi:epoxyqueuosine reductase QueG
LDIGSVIGREAKKQGAHLLGSTGLNGESVLVMAYKWDDSLDLGLLDKRAEALKEKICNQGFNARVISSVEENGVSLIKLARDSGLGFIGRSGLLITREFGSNVRLSAIATEARLTYEKTSDAVGGCGDCTKCQKTCPSGAILKKDPDLCRSYRENPARGGCTLCIEMCPNSR